MTPGGGVRVKALVVEPLVEELFLRLPLAERKSVKKDKKTELYAVIITFPGGRG